MGGRYPQTFVLADLAVDDLEPGTVNAYLSAAGPLLFFQLAEPATGANHPAVPPRVPRLAPRHDQPREPIQDP